MAVRKSRGIEKMGFAWLVEESDHEQVDVDVGTRPIWVLFHDGEPPVFHDAAYLTPSSCHPAHREEVDAR
jgi:hypothetical protein